MVTRPVPTVDELTTMFDAMTITQKRSGKTITNVVSKPNPPRKFLDMPAELLNSVLLLVSLRHPLHLEGRH